MIKYISALHLLSSAQVLKHWPVLFHKHVFSVLPQVLGMMPGARGRKPIVLPVLSAGQLGALSGLWLLRNDHCIMPR